MRYRLQRHDGTDCSATMVPITVLRMVPIQRYRQQNILHLFQADIFVSKLIKTLYHFLFILFRNNKFFQRIKRWIHDTAIILNHNKIM